MGNFTRCRNSPTAARAAVARESRRLSCFAVAVLVLAICLLSLPALGDTAIAFTDDVRSYGYCFDVEDAASCAEQYCFEGSGQTCRTRFRSEERGHFALALGSRGWGVGYSASDGERAGTNAVEQCWQQTQGCRLVESWYNQGP